MATATELRTEWMEGRTFQWLRQVSDEDRLVTVPFVFSWCERQPQITQDLLKYATADGSVRSDCALSQCFTVVWRLEPLAFFPNAVLKTVFENRQRDGASQQDLVCCHKGCYFLCDLNNLLGSCLCCNVSRAGEGVAPCPVSAVEMTLAQYSVTFGAQLVWQTNISLHRDALFASGVPDPEAWDEDRCRFNLVDYYWHRNAEQLLSLIPYLEEGRCNFGPLALRPRYDTRDWDGCLSAQNRAIEAQSRGFVRRSQVVAACTTLPMDVVHLVIGYTGLVPKPSRVHPQPRLPGHQCLLCPRGIRNTPG